MCFAAIAPHLHFYVHAVHVFKRINIWNKINKYLLLFFGSHWVDFHKICSHVYAKKTIHSCFFFLMKPGHMYKLKGTDDSLGC